MPTAGLGARRAGSHLLHPHDPETDPWAETPAHRAYLGETGAQVHLHEAGAPEGAPVVLLHRRRGTAGDWAPTLALGSWQVRMLAPDLPGSGLSDPVPGGEDAWAPHLAETLGGVLGRPALVVADEDSACVAVEMALAAPELVAGLVLLSPAERTACDLVEHLRRVTVSVWAAAGEQAQGAEASSVEVPGARWLTLPGVGDEPVTDHPDLVLDLVHGAVAELAASQQSEGQPQEGRRYITWVSSDACVNPSLSR